MSSRAAASQRRRAREHPRGASGPVARRRAPRRRRRGIARIALGALALAVLIPTLLPLAQKAIRDLALPLAYQGIIRDEAARERLDPALVAAVIYAETKFDARTSPAGAEGLMQIEPATAEFLARRSGGSTFTIADLAAPQVNIAYGSYYLRYLIDQYNGNVVLALAAYNAGQTNVDRWVAGRGG